MTITFTIDRETRDLLLQEATIGTVEVMDLEGYLAKRNRAAAIRLRDAAAFAVDLFEALDGWNDDAAIDSYEVTIDREPFWGWLIEARSNAEANIGSNVVTLAQQENGDEMAFYCDTQRESVAKSREYIKRGTADAQRITALIDQLRMPAVA